MIKYCAFTQELNWESLRVLCGSFVITVNLLLRRLRWFWRSKKKIVKTSKIRMIKECIIIKHEQLIRKQILEPTNFPGIDTQAESTLVDAEKKSLIVENTPQAKIILKFWGSQQRKTFSITPINAQLAIKVTCVLITPRSLEDREVCEAMFCVAFWENVTFKADKHVWLTLWWNDFVTKWRRVEVCNISHDRSEVNTLIAVSIKDGDGARWGLTDGHSPKVNRVRTKAQCVCCLLIVISGQWQLVNHYQVWGKDFRVEELAMSNAVFGDHKAGLFVSTQLAAQQKCGHKHAPNMIHPPPEWIPFLRDFFFSFLLLAYCRLEGLIFSVCCCQFSLFCNLVSSRTQT